MKLESSQHREASRHYYVTPLYKKRKKNSGNQSGHIHANKKGKKGKAKILYTDLLYL